MAQKKTVDSKAPSGIKDWQKDALSVLFLYALVLVLFAGAVFQNKTVQSGADTMHGSAISEAAENLHDEEGDVVLWFPYMFAGMPAFASGMYMNLDQVPVLRIARFISPSFYVHTAVNFMFGNKDHSWEVGTFFLAGVFMFLLARQLGFGRLIALTAAVGFMFCNFFVMSMAAGHGGKVLTIARLPLIFWAVLRWYERKSWLNAFVLIYVFGYFFFEAGHTQIIYYGMLAVGVLMITHIWKHGRANWKEAVTLNGVIGLSILLAIGFGAFQLLSQYVYSDVTMRSLPPALVEKGEVASGGMTFDYITNWSFHPVESLTFFIPAWFGLDSPYYWGWMTFTSSAFYFGGLVMVAAIVGLVKTRNWMVGAFATIAAIALLISFGRFFEPFFRLILVVLPFFDKFRVPSMILSVFAFACCVLACYGLQAMFHQKDDPKSNLPRKILIGMAAALVAALVGVLFKSAWLEAFGLLGENEAGRYSASQITQLKQLRADLLGSGFLKFIFLLEILLGMWYLVLKKKIAAGIGLTVILAVTAWDMIVLNKKTLKLAPAKTAKADFPMTPIVQALKQDSSDYRLFSLMEHAQSGSPEWTYHGIETIGGYSPTKMRIYQDIIDFSLYKGADPQLPINMSIVNMLNARYVVTNGLVPDTFGWKMVTVDQQRQQILYQNPGALPRAFFARKTFTAKHAQTRFRMLNSPTFDAREIALTEVDVAVEEPDSMRIEFVTRRSSATTLRVFTDKSALLVLSEIWYPHGWKALIDGVETPILKTNHILRAVVVPAGEHTIEFRFRPREYEVGKWISAGVNYLVCGGLLVSIGLTFWRRKR